MASATTAPGDEQLWLDALATLIRGAHTVQPSGLPALLNRAVAPLGCQMTIFLADLEQRYLRRLTEAGGPTHDPIPIDGSLAGRAFMTTSTMVVAAQPSRLWVPLLDGTERLGVLEVHPADELDPVAVSLQERLTDVAGLTGHLIVAKTQYGDSLTRARLSGALSAGAGSLWRLLPPLTFTSDRVAIAAVLEPSYDVGGDAFDYAVDSDIAHLAVLDAVGHGVPATAMVTVALGAIRAARINGQGLSEIGRAVDQALNEAFDRSRFVTAVLAELNCETGGLRYVNAGHPPPVVVREGRAVGLLDRGRRLPLGLGAASTDVAEMTLQPGDRLLFYTDGFTENLMDDGDFFGTDRLSDLAERYSGEGLPPPETLRRMVHHMLRLSHGRLRDDATVLLVHWTP